MVSKIYAKEVKSTDTILPLNVIGEWYSESGRGEYNGLLIHKNFIEWNYRAFMYQEINKTNETTFLLVAKDIMGSYLNCEIQILPNNTIKLKRGNAPFIIYKKQKKPINSERVTIVDIPKIIKQQWFTTNGENTLVFEVANEFFRFKDKEYQIDEIVNFKSNHNNEYRFIVKNEKEYRMFYFKNFSADYLQVGFNGKMGGLYKANKAYPDYRIDNTSAYLASIFPIALRGNWLTTDGRNSWTFGFYYNYAVLDKTIWNYKSVEEKGKLVVITLEKNGKEKIMYAKPNKDNTIEFGIEKNKLSKYSLNKTSTKDFKLASDSPYKESDIFKIDSTTYAGVIRNYNKESGQKTGMVYVSNIFTGNQDSYLLKIKEDGSFSVKFPLYYPQQVYIRLPNYNASVLVEPGKETWQLINSNKEGDSFFIGDLAQLNTDLTSLQSFKYDRSYYELQKNIKQLSLHEYKESCFNIHKKQVSELENVIKTRVLSNKAQQIMRFTLDYSLYERVLSYDMYNRESKERKIDSTYINFLTPEIYNNKLAIMASGYSSFVNRLRFCNALRKSISVMHPQILEFSEILKSKGVVFTNEEQKLVNKHINFKKENAEALKKKKDFMSENKEVLNSFSTKYSKVYTKISKQERENIFKVIGEGNMDSIVKYSNPLNIVFTSKEIEMVNKSNNLLTKEEQEKISSFHSEEQIKKKNEFYKTYSEEMNKYVQNELKRKELENFNQFFKGEDSWMQDLLIMQGVSGPIGAQLSPLSDSELKEALKNIKDPFVASYLGYENKKAIAKIEANKNNRGFVVNETPKTEADKVFEAIIAKYKGKVVFIDFWATWCGPCRSGMKKMKPLKEELKDKDIVFVYITNQTSPEKTYNNMIPNIKGEHYRVSKDEWNYLAQKFNISGIPHYTLVNKEGKVVKEKVYFASSADSFKQLFEAYLNK